MAEEKQSIWDNDDDLIQLLKKHGMIKQECNDFHLTTSSNQWVHKCVTRIVEKTVQEGIDTSDWMENLTFFIDNVETRKEDFNLIPMSNDLITKITHTAVGIISTEGVTPTEREEYLTLIDSSSSLSEEEKQFAKQYINTLKSKVSIHIVENSVISDEGVPISSTTTSTMVPDIIYPDNHDIYDYDDNDHDEWMLNDETETSMNQSIVLGEHDIHRMEESVLQQLQKEKEEEDPVIHQLDFPIHKFKYFPASDFLRTSTGRTVPITYLSPETTESNGLVDTFNNFLAGTDELCNNCNDINDV